ncbi:hypothetical protein Tco_0474033 [Tanacetum coccineum]
MRPRRLLRLLSDFDGKIRYQLEKARVLWQHALRKKMNEANALRLFKGKGGLFKMEILHGMDKEFENLLMELSALGGGVGYHALEKNWSSMSHTNLTISSTL